MTTHLNSHPHRDRADPDVLDGPRVYPPSAGAHRADSQSDTTRSATRAVTDVESTVESGAVAVRAAPTRVGAHRIHPEPNDAGEQGRSREQLGSRHEGEDMNEAVRVAVDNTHCAVLGICAQEAPAVFDLGVDGRLRYTARPAATDTAQVRQAARVCPMQAITVTNRR